MESESAGFNKKEDEKSSMPMMKNKVPSGNSPYVKAKYLQLVEKDAEASIAWFWKAIYAGDRVESALKDMAAVMKQLDRSKEAVEAIKSFRNRCSPSSQDSFDNVLIDLYKKCGNVDAQIQLIKHKLWQIYIGDAFRGKSTRTGRSHGRKLQISVQQETARLLGNLGWAYMQKFNFMAAEAVYRKAQMIEPNANKGLNLAYCLIKQSRIGEARQLLDDILHRRLPTFNEAKTIAQANELVLEIESLTTSVDGNFKMSSGMEEELDFSMEEEIVGRVEEVLASDHWEQPFRSKRLPVFEEILPLRDEMAC